MRLTQVVPFVLSQVWQVAEQFVPVAQQKWLWQLPSTQSLVLWQ